VPAAELEGIIDNIGIPNSIINLNYSNSAPIGSADADIMISLKEAHRPTADYVRTLRHELPRSFRASRSRFCRPTWSARFSTSACPRPSTSRWSVRSRSQPRVRGPPAGSIAPSAGSWICACSKPSISPSSTSTSIGPRPPRAASPEGHRQQPAGLAQRQFSDTPSYWLNRKTASATAWSRRRRNTASRLCRTSKTFPSAAPARRGRRFWPTWPSTARGDGVISHYNVQRALDIYGSPQDRDLGAVGRDIARIIDRNRGALPPGAQIIVRGQLSTMQASYTGLIEDCSSHRPGLPADRGQLPVLARSVHHHHGLTRRARRIVVFLFLTHTTLSVPALMGAIMCMGVATANSILVVSFAKDHLLEHGNAARPPWPPASPASGPS